MDHQPPKNNQPPPPQAGKFKPRKPAKKISVGGIVPESVTSTVVVPTTTTTTTASSNNTDQHRRRQTQGRGGRGGRGTGRGSRAPIPQGKAFFTAQPAPQSGRGCNHHQQEPSTVTSGSIDNQSSTKTTLQQQRQSRRKRDDNNVGMDDEEIVGTLDEAVGYSLNISSGDIDKLGNHSVDNNNNNGTTGGSTANSNLERALLGKAASSQPFVGPNGYMYDSDSSDENNDMDDRDDIIVRNVGVQRPLTLPFPSTEEHGSHSKVALETNDVTTASSAPRTKESKSQFPFLNTDEDAYFLVQLPTRLPPILTKNDSTVPNSINNNMMSNNNNYNDPMAVHSDPDVRIVEPVAVATPAIQSNAFDNVLTNAKPGRIGTLKIYRSGRTALVIDPSPGSLDTSSTPVSPMYFMISFIIQTYCSFSFLFPALSHLQIAFHPLA